MQVPKKLMVETGVNKLGTAVKEYIEHHLDVITDSDWFDELVTSKVNARIEEEIKELKNKKGATSK